MAVGCLRPVHADYCANAAGRQHGLAGIHGADACARYVIAAEQYVASDIRTAECIGGQGELPFSVHQGWQARVADFRRGSKFVTLDYSDAGPPKIYAGVAVALDQLNCQLLREMM